MSSNPEAVAAGVNEVKKETTTVPSSRCAPLLSFFACTGLKASVKRGLDVNNDGAVDKHDFDMAVDVLIATGKKSAAEATRLIKLANSHVADQVYWLEAAKVIFAADPEVSAAIDLSIKILKGFSVAVTSGEEVAAKAATITIPKDSEGVGETLNQLQETVTTAKLFTAKLKEYGVHFGISDEDFAKVNSTITSIAQANAKFLALKQTSRLVMI